jgi:hypothetical protein
MSSDRTAARLRMIAVLATQLAGTVDAGLERMAEWSAGGPGSRGSGTGRAGADPTGNAALAGVDRADVHARLVAKSVEDALALLTCARRTLALYPEPHVPARALLAAANGEAPAPGCRSCARIPGAGDAPRWEPADTRLKHPTTAGRTLDEPWWLCRWCNDTTRRLGRLPTPDELGRHHAGLRLRFTELPDPPNDTEA